MANVFRTLFEAKFCESTQTTQYTSTGVTTVISKFSAINVGSDPATLTVNLVPNGVTVGSSNVQSVVTLLTGESVSLSDVIGHVLSPGDFISTVCSLANSIVIRASGSVQT